MRRKLLNWAPTFADLEEVHPDIWASLSKLLDMPDQQVTDLRLYFQVCQAVSLLLQ